MQAITKKPIFLIVIGLVLGIVVAGIGLKTVLGGSAATAAVIVSPTPTPEPPPGPTYTIKDRIVNLADQGGRRYLNSSIVIEFKAPKSYYKLTGTNLTTQRDALQAAIAERGPVIDDLVTTILSSKTYNDIATPQGKEQAKRQIMAAIDQALPGDQVTNVYFTNFVVQ